jgi:hypothetical protein
MSAIHNGANQIDTHAGTARSVSTQMSALELLPDYNTSAGYILEEAKQALVTKVNNFVAMLDNHSAALRFAAGGFDAAQQDLATGAQAVANTVMSALNIHV